MAKFLDKKEQVIDFQLTPYGKHRLSVGQLKPAYYAFFDTGITYDSKYAGFDEVQTKIHERIKDETQFLEGVLSFEEAENTVPEGSWRGSRLYWGVRVKYAYRPTWYGGWGASTWKKGAVLSRDSGMYANYLSMAIKGMWEYYGYSRERAETEAGTRFATNLDYLSYYGFVEYLYEDTSLFDLDVVPQRYIPKPNILSFESSIGDARFEGENTQATPAWKILTCQGDITKIEKKDITKYNHTPAEYDNEVLEFNIPQINIEARYTMEISPPTAALQEEVPFDFVNETGQFSDGNTIKMIPNDVVVYAEEVNTELLTENFEAEVYEIIEDSGQTTLASALLNLASDPIAIGDTFTMGDGINTRTFEFINNTKSAIQDAQSDHAADGKIYVIVSNQYELVSGAGAASANRKGTLMNLISAINQDDGSTTRGYPTDYDKGIDGHTSRGRCKKFTGVSGYEGCYVGRHNLKIQTVSGPTSVASQASFPYPMYLLNTNATQGNPNQTITTTAASSRITIGRSFLGGYIDKGTQLKRLYFNDHVDQIVDGFMKSATEEELSEPELNSESVEYYFNILTDQEVSAKIACSCASTFNRDSYYVDIDFDCLEEDIEKVYYDIYGSATSPEICDLPSLEASAGNPFSEIVSPIDEGCED